MVNVAVRNREPLEFPALYAGTEPESTLGWSEEMVQAEAYPTFHPMNAFPPCAMVAPLEEPLAVTRTVTGIGMMVGLGGETGGDEDATAVFCVLVAVPTIR